MIDPITQHILEQESKDKYSKAFDRLFEEIDLSEYSDGLSLGDVKVSDSQLLAGAVITGMVARMAYKLYKDKISKIGKQCAQYKHGHPDRIKCEKAAKKKAMQVQIGVLKSGMSKCTKAKDADKCRQSIKDKIVKLQAKMQSM